MVGSTRSTDWTSCSASACSYEFSMSTTISAERDIGRLCTPPGGYDACVSHTTPQTFGALVLAVGDRVRESIEAVAGQGAAGPAALAARDGLAGGGSIDSLRRILGITHSGAVRLVDRLAAAGLVERRIGADARAVSIHLTPE